VAFAALVAILVLAGPGVPAAHAAGPALRVMPLGDSITWGDGSSTTSSYRADLWNSITGAGFPLDLVGSLQSGALPDRDHEGGPPRWSRA
jgi:hypothetical protein